MAQWYESSPLTEGQLLDEYFIDYRTQILDLAAFLDRLDRAAGHGVGGDFRRDALRRAVQALSEHARSRVETIQLLLSDPRIEPSEYLDRKSAVGAYEELTGGAG